MESEPGEWLCSGDVTNKPRRNTKTRGCDGGHAGFMNPTVM